MIVNKDFAPDYVYANVACPWLQVKSLQILQCFPAPTDRMQSQRLSEALCKILTETHPVKNVNRNNTTHAILFEAIKLIIEYNFNADLLSQAAGTLGRFVSMKDSNFKYLGLEAMARLAKLPNGSDYIRRHQNTVVVELGNSDISIRRRALDLAFEMCDTSNVAKLVETLLDHLETADYAIREELVSKISILASRYSAENEYVSYIMRLIQVAGDFVEDEIWFRAVRVIHGNDEIQESAAETILEALQAPVVHATMTKVACAVLGEFGHLIQHNDGCSLDEQLQLLHHKLTHSDKGTKCIIFTAICKLATLNQSLKQKVKVIAQGLCGSVDADLQQRAVEFCVLADDMSHEMFQEIYDNLPPYPQLDEAAPDMGPLPDEEDEVEVSDSEDATPKISGIEDDLLGMIPSPNHDLGDGLDDLLGVTESAPVNNDTDSPDLADLLGSMTNPPPPEPVAVQVVVATPVVAPATDLMGDLLGDVAAPAHNHTSAADDLLGSIGSSAPAAVRSVEPEEKVSPSMSLLLRSTKGVLYEDSNLQIGWLEAQPYANRIGQIGLYYQLRASAALEQFEATVTDPSGALLLKVTITN